MIGIDNKDLLSSSSVEMQEWAKKFQFAEHLTPRIPVLLELGAPIPKEVYDSPVPIRPIYVSYFRFDPRKHSPDYYLERDEIVKKLMSSSEGTKKQENPSYSTCSSHTIKESMPKDEFIDDK